MRLDRFDLNLLVVLNVLLRERNVTRAAERLNLGQAATSAALGRLRTHFEDELLVRVGRRMELTALAIRLVEPVGEALLRAREAIALRSTFLAEEAQRKVVVCASDYSLAVLLSAVVRELAQAAPGIELEIRNPPRDIAETFDRSDVDILILPEQYARDIDQPQVVLFDDDYVCVVCQKHPAASEGLSLEQYMACGHVAVRFDDERRMAFEQWFVEHCGGRRRVECSVDSFAAMAALLPGTLRVATLHRRQAELLARQFSLRVLEAPFQMPRVVERMIWPRHLTDDPAMAWIRARVAAQAQALAAVD